MRLRTALLLGVLLLVTGILAAVTLAVAGVLERSARSDTRDEVFRARAAFEELQAWRQALFRSEVRVIADEPRLKAVVAAQDVSHDTVVGVALDLKKVVRSDLFVLTDGQGRLLADTADPQAVGFELGQKPLVAGALKEGEAAGVWLSDGTAYQMQARRLDFGTTPVGVLVVGYRIDDRVAEALYRQTGTPVVIELADQPVAASPAEGGAPMARDAFAPLLAGVAGGDDAPAEVGGAERYLALGGRFPGSAPEQKLRYVIVRSLDRALAPARRLNQLLYLILALGLLVAAGLAVAMSRSLARPLDELVRVAHAVGGGDLAARAAVRGTVEVRALGAAMNQMVRELDASRAELATKQRLEREMEIANRIQVSILPRNLKVAGLEIAARMLPASEVGGDYYDVVPVEGGAWIGIGDVAGHGLTAGLVMMMIQSAVSALARERPAAAPHELLVPLNAVLLDNIRHRLGQDEHVTLSLLRYHRDGRFVYAGAHEEMVVWRAATGKCETVATPGTWLGAVANVAAFLTDHTMQLADGDLLVLYTDGVTEAWNGKREQFGLARLCAEVERAAGEGTERIRDQVLEAVAAWTDRQVDDVTLLVMRYRA